MILSCIILFLIFFLVGKFFLDQFSILESTVLGMFLCYFFIITFILLNINFENIFFIILLLSFFSTFRLVYVNYNNLKIFFSLRNFLKLKNIKIVLKNLFIYTIVILFFFENIYDILRNPLEAGDALAFWFYKAKFFIYNPGLEHFPQINYPNFTSSLWSISLYLFKDNFNLSRIILTFILFINILLVYYKFLQTNKNFLINSLLLFIFLAFYSFSTFGGNFRYSNSGYADIIMTAFLMSGFSYGFLSFANGKFFFKDYFFSCFSLGILSSIKNEGLIISIAILLITNFIFLLNFFNLYKKNFKIILLCNIFFIVISLSPLIIFKFLQLFVNENNVFSMFFELSNLINIQWERFQMITKYFILALIENRVIGIIILPLVFFNILYTKKFNIILQFIFLITIFCLVYIFIIYLLTKMPLEWHLVTSLNRIFFPFTGIISSLCFLILNYDYNKDQ